MTTMFIRNSRSSASLQSRFQQQGFTIVELIIVILLLGILTSTALPRFLDVTDEAHDVVVDSVFGGLNTGVMLFHAAYIAQGEPAANTAVTAFGEGTLRTNATGYPVSTTSDTDGAVDEVADCVEIYNSLLQTGRPAIDSAGVTATGTGLVAANITGGTGPFQALHSAATSTTCYYAYIAQYTTHAAAAAVSPSDTVPIIIYNSTTGAVSLSNSGSF